MPDKPEFKAKSLINKPSKSFQLTGAESVAPQSLVALLMLGGLIAFFFFGGWDWWTGKQAGDLYVKTAEDLEAQYRLMGAESSEMDKCVQAGIVAAAWLQAQDQIEYKNWKLIEDGHCESAGL